MAPGKEEESCATQLGDPPVTPPPALMLSPMTAMRTGAACSRDGEKQKLAASSKRSAPVRWKRRDTPSALVHWRRRFFAERCWSLARSNVESR
jgi:hypothetical protein